MAQLVKHLNLLDKIFQRFSCHVSFTKLLNCDFGSQPTRLKYITVATSPDEIRLCVDLQLSEVNVEVETIFLKGSDQACLLTEG